MPVRQEVLNVLLAQLLQERGLVSAPEQIQHFQGLGRRMPDVLVDFQGLRLAIEGEFATRASGTASSAEIRAGRAALRRVEQGIAHVGVALVYPSKLRSVAFSELKEELERATLRFAIITESVQQQLYLFPHEEPILFAEGNIDALSEALRRAYEPLIQDEVLQRAVALLEASIERFVTALGAQPAATERFKTTLEVRELPRESEEEKHERMSNQLTPKQRSAINHIAGLVLTNAMIFQEVLSQRESRISPLQEFQSHSDPVGSLADHWEFILSEINYYPIFHIAHNLLRCLSSDRSTTQAVRELLKTARQIVDWRASLRHDLAGRIYHRLLAEAKYLGAYYTSIPAAVLLLKLALYPGGWNYDWSDLEALKKLRIADLACGTGTLLMAAAEAVVDNHIRARAREAQPPSVDELHDLLVSEILYGFDVLESAIHLTASTLALRNPEILINVTHLGKRDLGGPELALGSLDFLESRKLGHLFAQPKWIVGKQDGQPPVELLPKLDLCVMNPPFTRSVGGNLLFGQFPAEERKRMQRKLRNLVRRLDLPANITAGLGSVFIALADRYLKDEGRLALVIPRTLLSGVAWEKTRQLLEEKYHLEWLIVSHEPGHWNFSENTNLSEVLVIARKREDADADEEERVNCVNFWRQPRNAVEALSVARAFLESDFPDVQKDPGTLEIVSNGEKLGEGLNVPWAWLRGRLWSFPCAFAQADLVRALLHLLSGKLYIPGEGVFPQKSRIPLCALEDLGELGFDVRDIHDGFGLSRSSTAYPAFWGHEADLVTTLAQDPNQFLQPLTRPKKGRPLRRASDLWAKAGRVLIVERLWLNTMRLTSVFVQQKVLTVQWWSFVPKTNISDEDYEKALIIWLNSTPGLILLLGHRQETRGAWVKFKKPVLKQMPVLDVQNISKCALKKLAKAFDQLADASLLPFPEMDHDLTRASIDRAVADALDLPDFSILRKLLAREPIICLALDRLLP